MDQNFDYIEIDKELVPYQFEIDLEEETFSFDVRYNERYDFFTVDLYKDDELLVAGEKLVYAQPLFDGIANAPAPTIIPLDPSGQQNAVTYLTLNETVFLIIDNDNGGE